MATNEPTDKQVEAAVRAFLKEVRPTHADDAWDHLTYRGVDIDDSEVPIVQAMRIALIAAARAGKE